jgi:hypothetical protein
MGATIVEVVKSPSLEKAKADLQAMNYESVKTNLRRIKRK